MQPHSGGKDEELLFTHSTVVVLNADSDTDIAPLVIAADHNTYIGPDAVLVHAGIDPRIDMLRDLSQHHIQECILVVISSGNRNDQIIPYLLRVDSECPSIAKDVDRFFIGSPSSLFVFVDMFRDSRSCIPGGGTLSLSQLYRTKARAVNGGVP